MLSYVLAVEIGSDRGIGMFRLNFLAVAVLVAFALSSSAQAQNIQNFKPAVGTWNYFSIDGALVAPHGKFVPSLTLNYGRDPLIRRNSDGEKTEGIVEDLGTANVEFAIGIADYLELGFDVPFHYASGEVLKDNGDDGFGLGDVRFIPKLRLFGLGDGTGVGMALAVPVEFPTGKTEKFVGSDQVIANPKLIIEARTDGFRFSANGGVRFRPDKQTVGSLELQNEVTYGAGLGINLGDPSLELLGEIFGAAAISDVADTSATNPLEALLGLRIHTAPGAVITLGGGTGIVADYGSPVWRALLQLAWYNRDNDRDKDGILDDVDQCPDDPEDKDSFEDENGCPDPDNDKDGILDVNDQCPMQPEDKDGFQDEDGCPDPDNDSDGILDTEDKCPNRPETVNNFQDADGCPDQIADTDGDGIPDTSDRCPRDPEDKDGFEDEDGCPDPDNDKDGILDVNDRCPSEPETKNGFEDEDGCPDTRPLTRVKIVKDKIVILEKVYFHTNKATIKKSSYDVLNEVAEVLRTNPSITGLRVEGHTDSRGSARYNKKLSQRRADSVRRFLIDHGISGDRLESVGFGEEEPIDTNKTREGRSNNRRVEFRITSQQK